MFDIGFWELAIIGLVALVVIGPDRLPGVARTAGKWVGRTRHFISQVKKDIDREIQQDELKKALQRDAGLDEIKEIMNTEQFILEEEDKPDYQVKAVSDEEVEASEGKKTDTAPAAETSSTDETVAASPDSDAQNTGSDEQKK